MTVLDTSCLVDLLLGEGAAEAVVDMLRDERDPAAPDVVVFEALAAMRREVLRGGLREERARAAVDDLADLPLDLFPALALRERAWELREAMTVADALFVVLAEGLGEPLATKDRRLAKAAAAHTTVEVRTFADPA